jgi:hypothetical protein
LPLDSATASTALLALPMARPIRSGIEPRHAWRLYAVVVDVDEATGNADTVEASLCTRVRYPELMWNETPAMLRASSSMARKSASIRAPLPGASGESNSLNLKYLTCSCVG